VVYVRVGENDGVYAAGRELEPVVVAVVGVTPLKHAAVDENAALRRLQQITRSRHLSRRSQETYSREWHRNASSCCF
jgi:hypothetical protein